MSILFILKEGGGLGVGIYRNSELETIFFISIYPFKSKFPYLEYSDFTMSIYPFYNFGKSKSGSYLSGVKNFK